MQDIRLVGNDGEYLNLETQSGDKFRLVLDDSLRSAVKRDTSVQLDSVSISPREIQDAVRAGATAEEVSAKHAVPLDYVEKFALTVVDEIGHIIASAQAVRIAIAADRYSEATQLEFGEVIAERIATAGGSKVSWSAAKYEGLPWHVTVNYETGDGSAAAVWSFDQRKLVLSPENELAIKFSASNHASSVPTPKLRPLDQTQVISLPTVEEIEPEVAPEVPTLSVVSSIEELTKASVEAAEAQVPVTPQVEPEAPIASEEPLSATADLLEALRKKRAAATKAEGQISEVAPVVAQPTVEASEQVKPLTTPVQNEAIESTTSDLDEMPAAPIAPAKKGRPSMPSWDEIVFGTKADD
ncbi:MAG: hypothetical protein RJB63_306 [Actinomycetota bacterium]